MFENIFPNRFVRMKKSTQESSGFTLRAVLIASGIALFLLTSSAYIAIKIGALPWPIVFSVVIAGGLIKLLNRGRRVNIHEVNVAQAGASIGGLVAAGVVFTVPGIIYLNQQRSVHIDWPNPWLLAILTATAGLLGVLLSVPLKYTFVDEEKLPYPAGTAGAEILKAGASGGRQLLGIIAIGSAAGVFALFRDVYFANGFGVAALASLGIFLTIVPMPLALGSGYILGRVASTSWFLGAVIGWLILMPVLIAKQLPVAAAKAVVQNLGMGMVLGSGIGFFVSYIVPRLRRLLAPLFKIREKFLHMLPILGLAGAGALWKMGVPLPAVLITLASVWIMVAVAARMTGETNINPLEQFGIFTGLVVAFVYAAAAQKLGLYALFAIVTFVSVACAVAGDAGHDYKSAVLVGTRFWDVVKVDLITAVIAGLAAPFVLEAIRKGFADVLFTPAMPAPQARLVAGSIFGFEYPRVFLAGFGLAFAGEVALALLSQRIRSQFMIMPLGIGLFLGLGLAIPIAIGALIRTIIDRKFSHLYFPGLLIAAAVMGGEGIAGFSAGALATLGLPFKAAAMALLAAFAAVLVGAGWLYLVSGKEKLDDESSGGVSG